MSNATYTLDDVILSWQLGAAYRPAGLAEAVDDALAASITPPAKSHEERVQERLRLFERCAERFHALHGTHPWAGANP